MVIYFQLHYVINLFVYNLNNTKICLQFLQKKFLRFWSQLMRQYIVFYNSLLNYFLLDEKGFIIIVALIATNVCAYSFSQISEIVKYEQQKKSSFDAMMQGINNEMNKRGLNILLQHKVRKYFEYQHFQNQQKQQTTSNLIDNLPAQMKEEVLLEVNYDQFSQECQKQISLCVKQKIVYTEDIIYREKENCDCIYYIAQGSVNLQISVKTKNKNNETVQVKNLVTLKLNKIHNSFSNNSKQTLRISRVQLIDPYNNKKIFNNNNNVFGYESFLLNQINPYTAKSNDITVLSYIEKSDLLKVLNQFPLDYEKLIYIKDMAILSKQMRQFDTSCISCGQKNHNFQNCPVINPQIKLRSPYFENQGVLNRVKMVRKRVSFYNPLKDKIELTRKAQVIANQNEEQYITNDIISLMNDSNTSESEDESSEDQKEQLSSDILDEEEERRMESKKLQKQQKSIQFQRQQKNNSLKEFKYALARMSEDNISFNTTPNSSSQNELAVNMLNSSPVSMRKLKSNDLDVIEEGEEETPIIPQTKRRIILTNPIYTNLNENKPQEKQQELKKINYKQQEPDEFINDSVGDYDKTLNDQNILASIRNRNKSVSQQSIKSMENLITNSNFNITHTPRSTMNPPFLSNFRAQLRDQDRDDLISLKSRQQNPKLHTSQKLENSQEIDSIILEKNINTIQPSEVEIEFKIGGIGSHKVISIPRINFLEGEEEEENCKDIMNEINSQKKRSRKLQDIISPRLTEKKLKHKKKLDQGQQFDINKNCNKNNNSLTQITSLDDLGSNPSRSKEIQKKSSFEYLQDISMQGSQKSDASNLFSQKQQQVKASSIHTKKDKMRQKSHSHIIENDTSTIYKNTNSNQIQHQHRKSIMSQDSNVQIILANHKKQLMAKQNNSTKKKADSGQNSLNNIPHSNEFTIYENKRQNQVNQLIDENQTSSEFQIRYKQNLQDLDMLIVRKKFLLEQLQGRLQNFIQVEDNEFHIDQMCEYASYYPSHNFKEFLKRYRKLFKKTYNKAKSPMKIMNNKTRGKRLLTNKSELVIKPLRTPNQRTTLSCMNSVSLEGFPAKI